MSAQEVTSKPTLFKIDGVNRLFRTVTTHENNDVRKTVYQQEIDESVYEERKLTTPTLVAKGDDGKYYTTVRTETKDSAGSVSETDSIYADLSFQKAFSKKGNNSLKSELNLGSIQALADNTNQPTSFWQTKYTQFKNVLQSVAESINFSSEDLPLELTTDKRRKKYENLFYPEDITTSKQDIIRFGMRYFSGRRNISFDLTSSNPLTLVERNTEEIIGSVTLPIPGGIQDQNSVKFDGETFDLGQAAAAGAILNPTGAASAVGQLLRDAITKSPDELQQILTSPDAGNIISALRLGLAQSFTGGNLLSRFGGGVLNPNMELLFQAPTLRSFKFSFTMSARSRTEATQIKKIIRFFKQGMSVKKSNNNIFVISPNVFTINFKTGDGREHPSIGRIKKCALLDLNTTYGNGNTYMTYDDPDRTMTQYKIDLTFQELEPITEDDYIKADSEAAGTNNFLLAPELDEFVTDRAGIGF